MNYVLRKLPMDCAYLEIGCGSNDLVDALPVSDKTGVDPVKGGTVRLTSDAFFETNRRQFDFVWIDGLHEYTQVHPDVVNALACLRPGGWIALHDLMPVNWKQEHMPRMNLGWTGDVWKVAVEIAATRGLDFRLILIDHGVGLLQVAPDADPLADMAFDSNCCTSASAGFTRTWTACPCATGTRRWRGSTAERHPADAGASVL